MSVYLRLCRYVLISPSAYLVYSFWALASPACLRYWCSTLLRQFVGKFTCTISRSTGCWCCAFLLPGVRLILTPSLPWMGTDVTTIHSEFCYDRCSLLSRLWWPVSFYTLALTALQGHAWPRKGEWCVVPTPRFPSHLFCLVLGRCSWHLITSSCDRLMVVSGYCGSIFE